MAIDKLSFGLGAGYDPPFAVDEVDVNRVKLRSKETAPLTHNTLDENFANLSLKINALIDTGIDSITIADSKVAAANLNISNGTGITYVGGEFAHQAKPEVATGYTETSGNISNKIITGINVDSMGHFVGFESSTGAMTPIFNSVELGGKLKSGSDSEHEGTLDLYDEAGDTVFNRHWSGGDSDFIINHNDTTQLIIKESGDVGIGTTDPKYPQGEALASILHVNKSGNTTNTGLTISNYDNTAGTNQAIRLDFGLARNSQALKPYAGRILVGKEDDWVSEDKQINSFMSFGLYEENVLGEKMRITSDGKVGIGTEIPDFLLDLEQKDGGVQLQIGRTNTAAGSAWMGADSTGFHLGVGAYGAANSVSSPNGFTVGADGDVGIGTTSPKQALQVEGGNIQCNHQIRATGWFTGDAPSAGPATEIGYSSGTGWIMAYDRANQVYSPLALQAGSVALRLNPTSGILEHSIDGGSNYSNLAHDSRSVAANDWIVGYGSTDHKRLSYNSAKKECVLTGGLVPGRFEADDTIGCYYKAKRIEPTVSKYRITIRARSSVAKASGFHIGVVYADSDTISDSAGLNTHVVTTSGTEENEEPPQDTFSGVAPDTLEVSFLRMDGDIEDSWGTYTYEISPPAGEKWFSVLLLNWSGMGNADLFFDPLIDVEPINPTFEYDSATGTLNIVNP